MQSELNKLRGELKVKAQQAELRKGLEAMGSRTLTAAAQEPNGLLESMLPWLETLIPVAEAIDPACEVLAASFPQHLLPLYDKHVDQMRATCQNNAVNASSKQNLRAWLLRTRRMYHAAGQSEGWDKRYPKP